MIIINLANVWSFCQAEKRLTFRLVRYWAFNILAFLLCIGLFINYLVIHAFGSSLSATVGSIGPRYILSVIGLYCLLVYATGTIFLSFDIRARDARERMLEVLDSRPFSNFELVFGRFLGLFLSIWVPIVILMLLLQGLGWLLPQMGLPIGGTIELISLISFPFLGAIPAIALTSALVILTTLLVKQRAVALILSIGFIAGLYSLSLGFFSYSVTSAFDLIGYKQLNMASDWVPSVATDWVSWLQRAGILLLALGMLCFAAIVHPRKQNKRNNTQLISASAISLLAVVMIVSVYQLRQMEVNQIEQWQVVHQAADSQTKAKIVAIRGDVVIEPGQQLTAKLAVTLHADEGERFKQTVFSLNPDFNLSKVSDAGGNALNYTFEQGLLTIDLSKTLHAKVATDIMIEYEGVPNHLFGYANSHIHPRKLTFEQDSVELFGSDHGIFDDNYVALMPGNHWLPRAGADSGQDDASIVKDFYSLDLKVTVPTDWLVAGPGSRRQISQNESANSQTFEFSPASRLSQVALLAAPFDSYSSQIDGVEFEMLIHPKRKANVAVLAKGTSQIKQFISDKLTQGRDMGLDYPFKAFTLVEVPNTLRGYAGGWRMDSVLSQPSMVLMKESSLPTARFDFDVQEFLGAGRKLAEEEDGAAKVMQSRLFNFFANDFSGGNVFTGAASSYFSFQTSAIGDEAVALDYTMSQLATLVLSGQRSYFSIANMTKLVNAMTAMLGSERQPGAAISDLVIDRVTSTPQVWESVLQTPLNALEPEQSAGVTLDLLAVKAGGVARLMYDIMGSEKSAQLLVKLLEKHRGGHYTLKDVIAIANQVEPKVSVLLNDYYTGTGLAGFNPQDVRLYQLPPNRNGDTRYQMIMTIANDELTAGYTKVSWTSEVGGVRSYSQPIRIEAQSSVEFGVVLSSPPAQTYIEPYLSLNRQSFMARQFNLSEIAKQEDEPLDGIRPVPWQQASDTRIVVDDLDSGFTVNLPLQPKKEELGLYDQGLPISTIGELPNRWSRVNDNTAWGKYRRTMAFTTPGDGSNFASLKTTIPKTGRWRLELSLPDIVATTNKSYGDWQLKIVTPNGSESVTYNTKEAIAGWNIVGQYELAAGEVSVEFSNASNGIGVLVDAIVWTQMN